MLNLQDPISIQKIKKIKKIKNNADLNLMSGLQIVVA